ncbi:DUF554 domain-containing protein [Tenuifilum thalassicum]|uniref:DUF554 domain-containing protein n=1 Tax=Tenuifilum thalassicum TaxID=2590900 RepID=A0A7D4CH55_9BACT|nr:DUF554 domain-containing protein [Tenuifilum thalassicum]QKG80286.1 DUF554 domain-containing protein [Tenuifilum thalassicum]
MLLGTLINVGAILVGGTLGLIIGSKLPERYSKVFFQVVGLFTLVLGFSMALKTEKPLLVIFSLILGAVSGTIFDLEKRLSGFSDSIKNRFNVKGNTFSEGLIVAFLLYCMGSLTVLGAIEEGTGGYPNLFFVKSLMDGFSSIVLASTLGVGVLFSVIPLLLYQGGLTVLASYASHYLSDMMVNELSAVGGILLIALGLNILEVKRFDVLNFIPSLIFIVIFVSFFG